MLRNPVTARLPGIRFETVRPRRPGVLPRMDIALFVGFAVSGPLHVPVPIEDCAAFEAIFGGDLPLAWDSTRGETVFAYLAPAVRDFFRNGGQRCWVVRVADDLTAHTAYFPIPGLARFDSLEIHPAFAAARSPGSWGDALQVSAALSSLPLSLLAFDLAAKTLDLALDKPGVVVAGDLLRLDFSADGWFALFAVASLDILPEDLAPDIGQARHVRAHADTIHWFRPVTSQLPAVDDAKLAAFTHTGPLPDLSVTTLPASWPADNETPLIFDYAGLLDPPLRAASSPGALVRITFSDDKILWLRVTGQTASDSQPDIPGAGEATRFSGQGVWHIPVPPDTTGFADPTPYVEKLTFELWSRTANHAPSRLVELGFAPGQPRYWAALPDDEALYTTSASITTGDASFHDLLANPDYLASSSVTADGPYSGLWRDARSPRFPLAGAESGSLFLPLLLPPVPDSFANPDEPPGDALTRDGLSTCDASLFLDPELADTLSGALQGLADDIRYMRAKPRRLRGIHAALSVEEATLVAVPDAIHRGWFKTMQDEIPDPEPSLPPERPVWWRFLPCKPSPDSLPRTSQPEWGEFLRCGLRIIPAPVLSADPPDATGTFLLSWTALPDVDTYILEESAFPNFNTAREIYRGTDTSYMIYGYGEGDYYFRVRAEAIAPSDGLIETSDYSNGIGIRIAPGTRWALNVEVDYNANDLLAVQRDLLRLSAVRGDLFAALSEPLHYRAEAAIAHALNLRSPLSGAITVKVPDLASPGNKKDVFVAPIGYGEARALSFGALYHPWLSASDGQSQSVRLLPPDGFVLGVIARRSFERGAWIAPANNPLRGVLGLLPVVEAAHWLDIQEAKINLIRDEPQGYLALSASTLSDDPDWTLINVRRLISLLRRLATKYGPTFVFEPNSDAFRRLVQREFSALLDQMFARGAFAGATPETSYQVAVIVTAQDIDAGRFTVELRVAPSLPMRFITVRLVQSGERSQVTEGG
jgi:hypothetical protein